MEENFNKHLGNKLKLRRLSLGLTQTKVAKAINVTFQQIQKYEKGTNGVSSIRLLQLSNYLKVPISYFFEDSYFSWKNSSGQFVEGKENEYYKWQGLDLSLNINSTTQLSLFYGSQKGGLVCANGVCADQPGFDDGMKLTLRSLF